MFNIEHARNLGKRDAEEYIKIYFYPLSDGNHLFYDGKDYNIVDDQVIKKVYFNRLSTELNKFYFKEYAVIRTVVCKLGKEQFYENYFNVCPEMKAKLINPKEQSEDTIDGVKIFLSYILEVLANKNNEVFEYLLDWISNMLKGNKNDSCLYLKGAQGIGKSTISDFLKDHVLGRGLFLESGSQPLKSRFNKILEGKLLVQFTELENFSVNEWSSISSVLKRQITSNTISIEGKNTNPYDIENINNYILDSNNDAIKDDDGRRYFILDVSHEHKQDLQYFGKIRSKCFNDDVGNAFYTYLLNRDTCKFIPQNYPLTKSKLNSYVKRLDNVYEFIKSEYVLKKKSLKIKPIDLHHEYIDYCKANDHKTIEKIAFIEKLEQVNIKSKKQKLFNVTTIYYNILYEELKQIADKNKWIHETDEEQNSDFVEHDDDDIMYLKNDLSSANKLIEELKKQNEALKKQLEDNKKEPVVFTGKKIKITKKIIKPNKTEVEIDMAIPEVDLMENL